MTECHKEEEEDYDYLVKYLTGDLPNDEENFSNREDSNKRGAQAHTKRGTNAQNIGEFIPPDSSGLEEQTNQAMAVLGCIDKQLGVLEVVEQLPNTTEEQTPSVLVATSNRDKQGGNVTQSDSSNQNINNSNYSASTDTNIGLGPGDATRALEERSESSTFQARPREEKHEMGNFVYVANKHQNNEEKEKKKAKIPLPLSLIVKTTDRGGTKRNGAPFGKINYSAASQEE